MSEDQITVRLYGELREVADRKDDLSDLVGIVKLPADEKAETVSDILHSLGISAEKVSHIFIEGRYADPGGKVRAGDRVAVFPEELSLLYKWYFRPDSS